MTNIPPLLENGIFVTNFQTKADIYIYKSCSILKKESKLTFDNVPTMSWIQSTEISGELLFSQLLDSFLEIYRDLLQRMAGLMLACDF